MGAFLETGIIVKISSKQPIKEALKEGCFQGEYKNLNTEIFTEIYNEEEKLYEYYPKYFEPKELEKLKLQFLEEYPSSTESYEEQKKCIIEFFKEVKASSSKELFEELEEYRSKMMRYNLIVDEDQLYMGYKVYKLRLACEGKFYMEGYGNFISYFEKLVKERYQNGYSEYINVSIG